MENEASLPVAERLIRLLRHLGIHRAHFGAQLATELSPFLAARPEAVASLALLGPNRIDTAALAPMASRLVIFTGDSGVPAEVVGRAMPSLPDATLVSFPDYFTTAWSDIAADHAASIAESLARFLARAANDAPATELSGTGEEGEVAGISFRVSGSGPALVLLPLLLAPSQWEPLVPMLSERCCVVVLSGAALGMVAVLENRGLAEGYLRAVRTVVDEVALEPGHAVLDVGCGTGALDRWLARRTRQANPIVALDSNAFLLREARALAEKEGLAACVDFREGNAEALPFDADRFDVTMAITLMEECDADRLLAEMCRVTRPGGRVAVIVRATDMPMLWNLPLPPEIKSRVEAPLRSVAERGCADVGLYRRFRGSGLADLKLFPQFMTTDDPESPLWQYNETYALSILAGEEAQHWHAAKIQAIEEGTQLWARPLHCAIGTKA